MACISYYLYKINESLKPQSLDLAVQKALLLSKQQEHTNEVASLKNVVENVASNKEEFKV